jgi:hypothetical protein
MLESICHFRACADADDEVLVNRLVSHGFARLEADRLAVFLPIAFDRVILERLGLKHFTTDFSVRDRRGKWVHRELASESVYVTGLELAREARATGVVSCEDFRAVVLRRAELNAANDALNQGLEIKDGCVASALVRLCAEDFEQLSA